MKPTEAKLLGFLQKSPQFVMPICQRTYSWTDRKLSKLGTTTRYCTRCPHLLSA